MNLAISRFPKISQAISILGGGETGDTSALRTSEQGRDAMSGMEQGVMDCN